MFTAPLLHILHQYRPSAESHHRLGILVTQAKCIDQQKSEVLVRQRNPMFPNLADRVVPSSEELATRLILVPLQVIRQLGERL